MRGALRLAGKALDAVSLPNWVRAFLAAGRFSPIVERHGADANAYAVADADIPVHGNVVSVNAQLTRFGGTPNIVSIMFAYNFTFSLKIRVYRQKIHHF